MMDRLTHYNNRLGRCTYNPDAGGNAWRSMCQHLGAYEDMEDIIQGMYDDQFGLLDLAKEYIKSVTELNGGKQPKRIICLSDEDADLWDEWKERIRLKRKSVENAIEDLKEE